ncbi:3144_t:CDS:2 [Diversispora eburnea]|uniref:3144_t:CDS:1 n=1 Tax=Diversispora eburnea TaxID=1213867 RepID=A0A9N9F959_9GLOM|nr:3144_t:CDS:2 [Diversispora eburnea]
MWDAYFEETLPGNYSFLGFYKHRQKRTDFTHSFQKEADILRKSLDALARHGTEEVKKRAVSLGHLFNNHRNTFKEVEAFWDKCESTEKVIRKRPLRSTTDNDNTGSVSSTSTKKIKTTRGPSRSDNSSQENNREIIANALTIENKKRMTAIEKATLCYGASRIIDLSTQMKEWFSIEDRKFIMNKHKSVLKVPEMYFDESTFAESIEKMINQKRIDVAYERCIQQHCKSEKNSYMYKISKIYSDFIFKCMNDNMLDSSYTKVDVMINACSYIIQTLRKGLKIQQRWSDSYCPSADDENGCGCNVRFLSTSGIDIGKWNFSENATASTASKIIGDRCLFGRINQSILNGLLNLDLTDDNDNVIEGIFVPFIQFSGTSGQVLVEGLVEGYYVVFPGPKFKLPTELQHIKELKPAINIMEFVMVSL